MWHSLKFMLHTAFYYNVTFKKVMWLNRLALDQMEFVVPMMSNVPLWIVGNGRAAVIHMPLFHIKDTARNFE
jgi:hypothetical protein